ncbi:hyalin-like [Amphiura filiformis]|uniref:hyalin-like n=1 Tax=Amphiura filiformis TaxID=82378 RepID=UPI003B21D6D9
MTIVIVKVFIGISLVYHLSSLSDAQGTQTCDQGWPILPYNRGNNDGHGYTIVSSKEFSCYGYVTQWSWYAKYSSRPFRAVVWRPVSGYSSRFKIVGINDIPSKSQGSETFTVPESQRITVEPGDVIGWSFQYHTIRYDTGGSDLVHWRSGNLYSSLQVNQIQDFNEGIGFRQYSIRATVLQVIDVDPPVVSGCPRDIAPAIELGMTETAVNWTEPTAIDDTAITEGKTHSPGDIFQLGITHVAYIFKDLLQNRAACTFTINVHTVDTIPPSIFNCTNITTSTELGTDGTNVSWSESFATDLSGTPRLIRSHEPSTKFPIGQTPVTYLFIDTSDNADTCSFTVTVNIVDTTTPTVTGCPSDFNSVGGRHVTWREPDAWDLSENITIVKSHLPGLFVSKQSEVVYAFTDSSGNTAFCRFTIYMSYDTVPPVVSDCDEDIEAYAELGVLEEPVYWTQPSATDDYGRVMLIQATHSPGERFPIKTTSVMYLFADDSYNIAYCNFSVVVHEVDTTPPTIHSCPSDISLDIQPGRSRTPVYWMAPSATDVSGNVSLVSQSHHPGDAFTTGNTEVVYVFKDGSNNEARCAFQVNLREVFVGNTTLIYMDTAPPAIVNCPSNIHESAELGILQLAVSWLEPSAVDLRGISKLQSATHRPGALFPVESSTEVSYVFVDDSGNLATCNFPVTVSAGTKCVFLLN